MKQIAGIDTQTRAQRRESIGAECHRTEGQSEVDFGGNTLVYISKAPLTSAHGKHYMPTLSAASSSTAQCSQASSGQVDLRLVARRPTRTRTRQADAAAADPCSCASWAGPGCAGQYCRAEYGSGAALLKSILRTPRKLRME
jgi:hypothetical protein